MKQLVKISIWVVTILVGIILLVGIFTQTPLFRTWLKDFAVSEVNDILQGELAIEKIDGNLFSNLNIHNLLLSDKNDSVLIISKIHLSYNLLDFLNDKIEVHQLTIDDPEIRVSEDSLGIWNFSKLISNDTISDTTISENDSPFGFIISVDSFSLLNGTAKIKSNNNLIPKKISQLNINLNGLYSSNEIHLNLDSLSFQTEHPDFTVNKIGFNFLQNGEDLLLKNLIVKTGTNKFESDAKHHQSKNNYINLTSENLNLQEFEFILPEIKLKKNPDIRISSQYNLDSLEFEIGIQSDGEYLTLKGRSKNYLALFDSSKTEKIRFILDLVMNNMRIGNWSDQIPEANITGEFRINGSFTGLNDLEADISGEFRELQLQKYTADLLRINADYYRGNLIGNVHLLSNFANLYLQLNIKDLLVNPHYDGTISVSHLDIGEIVFSDNIKSDLNFNLHVQGVNFLPPDNFASFELDLSKSQIKDLTIDSLSTAIQLSGSRYNLETFQIKTLAGIFTLSGSGDLESTHRINYVFDPGELQNIVEMLDVDSLYAKGQISGVISGKPDSLINDMHINLHQLKYNEIKIDSLAGNTVTNIIDSSITMTIDLISKNINTGAVNINKVKLESKYNNEHFTSKIDIEFNSDLSSSLSAIVRPDSILFLSIPHIKINVIGEEWNGKLEKMIYDTGNNELEIKELDLKCTSSDDPRSLFAEGMLSPTGPEDFRLKIEGIHPKTLLSYLGLDAKIDGRANFNLDLSGTADKPVFKGFLRFGEGFVSSIKYQGISSHFNYEDDRFHYNFALDFNGRDSLIATGYLPLHLSLTDTFDIFNPEEPIDLEIKSEGIPIGLFFSNLKILPEISGTLFCDFTLKNTLIDPTIRGNLQLKKGVLRSPHWGIDYQDIELNISAIDDKFSLEKFQIFTAKGNINASGEIQLDYKKPKRKIIYSNLRILADKFYLVQHKDFEIQISTDIKYQMEQGKPKLSGYVDVNKSSFYLPTIINRAGYVTMGGEEIKPALVIARNRKLGIVDRQKELSIVISRSDTLQAPGFLELLEGDLELRITRNTWVRNPQLRVELGGKLNMTMKEGDFFLKGPVDIVRGQYDLLGRRFTVIQGKIEFQGLQEINPPLYLEAEYIYRTIGREKRSLVLKVTGNIEYPIITFLESNNEISQDDAIAIIIYGRKTDELSFETQLDVADAGVANSAAMGLVSNMVSNQLSRSVGDDLKLDVIEVNATDNWQSANFVIGKYIADDIFVTYKREFGQNLDNNLYPETISMEYEIQKNLFLQLIQGSPQVSGYDLLFRVDWD